LGVLGSGAAKLLLFGEHAAVYGYPAVGIGVPLHTNICSAAAPGAPAVGAAAPASQLPAALRAAIAALDQAPVSIDSDIPQGLGFGSSAALCAAVARAGAGAPASTTNQRLWRHAHRLERAFHGAPSGADTGLALHGGVGLLSWQRQDHAARNAADSLPDFRQLPCVELHLVAGAVPRQGSTAAQVARIAAAHAAAEPGVVQALARLGALSEAAAEAFAVRENPGGHLGALASQAHTLLTTLGLADAEQDAILGAGMEQGAAGGKLSGGGGGGAFLLFCESERVATDVFAHLRGSVGVLLQLAVAAVEIVIPRSEGLQRSVGRLAPDA
jgi:mevalonate kinase